MSTRITKSQVDRIGEEIRSGGLDAAALVQLSDYRNQFDVSYKVVEDLLSNKLGLAVSGRPAKSTTAIIEKLQRESIRLSQIQDIAGCRVIVPGMHAQNNLSDTLMVMLENPRIIDRRGSPSHGYRAVHVIAMVKGLPVEVQIRTRLQHTWADLSEKLADAYGQEIKYGKGHQAVIQLLADLSIQLEKLEKLRFDQTLVNRGDQMRYHRLTSGKSMSKLMKELGRMDRECLVRIGQILSSEID